MCSEWAGILSQKRFTRKPLVVDVSALRPSCSCHSCLVKPTRCYWQGLCKEEHNNFVAAELFHFTKTVGARRGSVDFIGKTQQFGVPIHFRFVIQPTCRSYTDIAVDVVNQRSERIPDYNLCHVLRLRKRHHRPCSTEFYS